jgi:excisionase family DNA binding protein
MNTEKAQQEINSIIAETRKGQPVRKQYPVAKHQIVTLTDLGLIDLMPAGFGYSDAASVIKVAQDSGSVVGGFLRSGEGDVTTTEASALYQAASTTDTAASDKVEIGAKVDIEPTEVHYDLWQGATHNPDRTAMSQPIFDAIVTGIFEDGSVEVFKNGDYQIVSLAACKPNRRPLTTQEAAAALSLSRRAVLKACEIGTLNAEKLGRDWLISSEAVRDYRKTYHRRPGRK